MTVQKLLCYCSNRPLLHPFERSATNHGQRKIVITGFNTDVEHEGVVYHVQTEDKGLKSPLLLSLVYVGGTILASKRTPYEDLIAAGFDEKKLAERLQRQHKLICAAIKAGRIEDLKKQTERESASRAKTTEQGEKGSPEEVEVSLEEIQEAPQVDQTEVPEPIPIEEFIIETGNIADSMPPVYFAATPVEPKTVRNEPQPEVVSAQPVPEVEHVDYSRVVDYSQPETPESDLLITLLEEKKFVAGEFVKIMLHVGRGWEGHRSVQNASVTLKVLGSSFRPLIFSGKTALDGTAIFYAMLPYFTSGRAAILVSAADNGERAELRRVIHQA